MISSMLLLFLSLALSTRAQNTSTAAPDANPAASSGASPYWHDRYHGFLASSAMGDYATKCPLFFTNVGLQKNFPGSVEAPWTILSSWGPTQTHGLTGYSVVVPEMNKTVMVFSEIEGWEAFNATPAAIPGLDCPNCTAHAGALLAYQEAKILTGDWEDVQYAESINGHIWSLTGIGFGGMVAQVAALDLGYRNLAHAIHTFGAPRTLNPAAAQLYNKLFLGSSNSRTVANNDIVPTLIPESEFYTMVPGGFHVFGSGNTTYGQNYIDCGDNAGDPECLGGDSYSDHWFYYTQPGECGQDPTFDVYNQTLQAAEDAALSSSYVATATTNMTLVLPTPTTSTTTTTTTTTTTVAPTSSAATASGSSSPAAATTASKASSGSRLGLGGAAVVVPFLALLGWSVL